MKRREFLAAALGAGFGVAGCFGKGLIARTTTTGRSSHISPPNIIFILADDLGYADLGCYGATKIRTANLDRLATEGMRFTSFYTHPVCGPTRTAILTGCYPMRVAEYGNRKRLHPLVHLKEVLIPEVLRPAGYKSACIGKWNLNGHSGSYPNGVTPNAQGFDFSYGRPAGGAIHRDGKKVGKVPTADLTRLYTDEALRFIEDKKKGPFFVYLAHTMPHVPLAASEKFKGKSARGLYGDVVEELDWHVGRVIEKVRQLGIMTTR